MQFISNKILNPAGVSISFNDYLAKILKKTAESDEKDDTSKKHVVNNDNEPGAHSYQEGESVDGKPDQAENKSKSTKASVSQKKQVVATCGKEMGESDDAGKVTEKHTPASSTESGSEEKSGPVTEQFINNDPNYQKGESVKMKKKEDSKSQKESGKKSTFQKISSLNRKQRLQLMAQLGSNKHNPREYLQAMAGLKLANLTKEEKSWLRKFWLTQYPEAYVNEMLADR